MSTETLSNRQWLEENEPRFVRAAEIAEQIELQNQLYSELVESGQVTTEAFRIAVRDHLSNEQNNAFKALIEAASSAPYEELAARELQLYAAIGKVAAQLTSIEEQQNERVSKIRNEKELVSDLIPELAPKLSEITLQLEQSQSPKALIDLKSQHAELMAEYETLSKVYEVTGRAWPIPRLVTSYQEKQIIESETQKQQEDLIVVDDFPAEKQLISEHKAETVRRNYPEEKLPDASLRLALILAEEPKKIYDLGELAEKLYRDNNQTNRARVRALISCFERGIVTVIRDTLSQEGLVLQRGIRRTYDRNTRKQKSKPNVVFRAVPIIDAEQKERIVHSQETLDLVDDNWRTVTIIDATAPNESVDDAANSVVNGNVSTEANTAESLPEDFLGPGTIPLQESLAQIPNEEELDLPVTDEIVVAPSAVEAKTEPDWLQQFKQSISEKIAQLEEDGLMEKETISWKLVGRKTSSKITGTRTMLERAIRNHIISRDEASKDSELKVSQIICMSLQNIYQNIFNNRSLRNEAIEIVEQAVAQYFENKN